MKRTLSVVGAGVAALLAFTACSSAPAEDTSAEGTPAVESYANMEELITAAKAEGQVQVYSQVPEQAMTMFAEGFQEEYGITVNAIRLGGTSLATRFDSEVEAGTASADVLLVSDVEYLKTAAGAGSILGFSETGAAELIDGFPANAVFEEYDAPAMQVVETGWVYNTGAVQENELPASWADLSNDRWAENYCAVDPAQSLNSSHYFWKMREEIGDEALLEVGNNVGRWYPNVIAMNEAVAVGECELGMQSPKFMVALAQGGGAPIEFAEHPMVIPGLVSAAVATDARNPAAALLFMTYILGEEGNRLLTNPETGSLGPWDLDLMPEGWTAPTAEEFVAVRDQTPEVVAALGL